MLTDLLIFALGFVVQLLARAALALGLRAMLSRIVGQRCQRRLRLRARRIVLQLTLIKLEEDDDGNTLRE